MRSVAIIGTGIFVLVGTAIVGDEHRPGAGPGIVLSFVLSGLTCALAALCYAEFAAMIRRDLVKWEKVVRESGALVD